MKKILLFAISSLFILACGGDDDPVVPQEPVPSPTPLSSLTLESQSIQNGTEVDAATTTQLLLTYNMDVSIAANADIALNGSRLTAKSNGHSVEIPLTLQDGTNYSLRIPKGAVTARSDASMKAPAFTLSFKTTAKETTPSGPSNPNISFLSFIAIL